MEDSKIIELYWQRDERAVEETSGKYGGFCFGIAMNLLSRREDAEECVNDTWQAAWEAMPPQRPIRLRAWLGRVTRNLSMALWKKNHAQKRGGGMEELLDELEDCVPSPRTVEGEMEARELAAVIDRWLLSLSAEDRALFVRRYWNGEALQELAELRQTTPAKLAQRMLRLRRSLKMALEREDIFL